MSGGPFSNSEQSTGPAVPEPVALEPEPVALASDDAVDVPASPDTSPNAAPPPVVSVDVAAPVEPSVVAPPLPVSVAPLVADVSPEPPPLDPDPPEVAAVPPSLPVGS